MSIPAAIARKLGDDYVELSPDEVRKLMSTVDDELHDKLATETGATRFEDNNIAFAIVYWDRE